MRKTMTSLLQTVRAFARARRGNVAMMFAIALVPLTIAAGVGLDYARQAMVKNAVSEALDAAALSIGSTKGLTTDTAKTLAQAFLDANYKSVNDSTSPKITDIAYNPNGSVTLTATATLPATLLKVAGYANLGITTSSTVVWGQTKLWVALVLDNSGSMDQGDSSGTKLQALKNASGQLLTTLQNASSNAGDVQVAIIPFVNVINIGTSYVSSSSIDWTDWEAAPPNVTLSSSVGPGSNCPFTTTNYWGQTVQQSPYGFNCTSGSANSAGTVNTIPSSGLICPGIDSGTYNTAHRARYYNGCWTSTISQTKTVTSVNTTPITDKQSCSQVGSGTITCTDKNNYPQSGNTTNNTTTTYSDGYSGDSTSTTSNTVTNSTSDGSKSCSTSHGVTTCTWTRTITQTKTDTTITKTANGGYTHTWVPNDHSTWSGCVMDRTQDYDIKNTQPTTSATKFPATNPQACPDAAVTTLGYNWTSLSSKIQNMDANGSTNQAIGVAHGWQMLTPGDPYGTSSVPANTSRYIILLSDGLNTQDRWWGNGSTEGTTEDGYIDAREKTTCDNAKADGITIYTIYLNIGGDADSAPLSYCASDSSKYFELTTTGAVVTAFSQIAQQITAVRVSK